MLTIENRAGVDVLVMGNGCRPASEAESAFYAEITRLRAEVEALKAENAALASWQCLFTDGTTGLYHDGCGNAQCARDHLVVHLTAEVEALRGITPELPPRPPDGGGLPRYGLRHNGQSMPMSVPMADGYWTPYHLAIAEVEALRADAERWRYINERNGEWRRFEADGPDPAYSMLCVRLPYDADLSCRATREIAIDAARAAQGGKT